MEYCDALKQELIKRKETEIHLEGAESEICELKMILASCHKCLQHSLNDDGMKDTNEEQSNHDKCRQKLDAMNIDYI